MESKTNGHFPVSILNDSVIELFNTLCASDAQLHFAEGLRNRIKLMCTDEPITEIAEICPCSNEETLVKEYQIKLYDNFCQFFWCLCYSVVALHEEYISTPTAEGSNPDKEVELDRYQKKAYDLFSAGVSLFDQVESNRAGRCVFFSLPMPNSADDRYVRYVNNAYTAGINFILLHELKHFELDHLEKTNEDKQDETDADLGAFWHLILSESPEEHKRLYSLGVLLAQCSLTFLDDTMEGDEFHPDPDVRIASILSCNEIIEHDREYYYAIICLCFKLWYFQYKDQNDFPQIEKVESWEMSWREIVEHIKVNRTQNS